MNVWGVVTGPVRPESGFCTVEQRIHTHPPPRHRLVHPRPNVECPRLVIEVVPNLSDPPERIDGRTTYRDFIAPRIVNIRIGRISAVIGQRPRRSQGIVLVVARRPDRPVLAILADQVAVRLRLVGVDGLDFVLVVGFGEVVFKIPRS